MSPITVVSVSIGPVQEFIAAARRTRDFAFGSFLLAQLARTATKIIHPHAKPIVFPAAPEADAANKILYIHDSSIAVPVLMDEVDRALRALVETEIRRIVADKRLPDESILRAVAHVRDVVEFYWASATHDTYPEAYRDAEAGLAARKSFRDFAAFPMGSSLPKSSITGTYESIIPEELHSPSQADRLFRDFRARSSERLSGVDILKRLGDMGFAADFPSIAVMAARSALIRSGLYNAETNTLDATFDDAWRAIDAEIHFHSTGESIEGRTYTRSPYKECLFASRLGDEIVDDHLVKQIALSHASFTRTFNLKLDKPYYAILQADGDRMGALIQECLHVVADERAHVAFSTALSQFSAAVQTVVARYVGVMVYSGGDDVLALLPVQTAIPCAAAIQHAFVAAIQPVVQTYGLGTAPSVSVGVVVAHHMDPMSDVLQLVRQTESSAKKERSSLAVAVSKRSGGVVAITGTWGSGIVARLTTLINDFASGVLPHGYAYELRALVDTLYRENTDDATTAVILALESERILKRKSTASGSAAPVAHLSGLRASIPIHNERDRTTEWVNELIVAREIA